jgi:hypothetical protein
VLGKVFLNQKILIAVFVFCAVFSFAEISQARGNVCHSLFRIKNEADFVVQKETLIKESYEQIAEISAPEIVARLNTRFRKFDKLNILDRMKFLFQLSFNWHDPYVLTVKKDLIENGEMPLIAKANEVILVKKSREEGIEEIKNALDFPEERAWLFIPSQQVWIYNSIGHAESTGVGMNGLLSHMAQKEFGAIELYHTHPEAAMEVLYRRAGGPSFTDFERFHQIAAVPSPADIHMLRRFIEVGETHLPVIGYIVHSYGLTSYSVRVYHQELSNGSVKSYFPNHKQGNLRYFLKWLRKNPETVIRNMLEENVRASRDVSCAPGPCPWSQNPSQAPRVFLELLDY